MSKALYIAAGGGGDAIAAAMVHALTGAEPNRPAVIATWAWERLLVDPLPGPRSAADFTDLDRPVPGVNVITAKSAPVSPSQSFLPRLSSALPAVLVLLDPSNGVTGLAAQITSAVAWTGAEVVDVVDVGGDALGRPGDQGLRSPLADIASLVATAITSVPARLTIAGPGLDGELPPTLVHDRLAAADAVLRGTLDPGLARRFAPVLDWNPSEATAVLLAGALGVRGTVEIRDRGFPVELTTGAAGVWTMKLSRAWDNHIHSPIARTRSLSEIRQEMRRIFGVDEIGYEEDKARRGTSREQRLIDAQSVDSVLRAARERGSDWVTRRRIREALGGPIADDELRRMVGERWQPPLIATR